MPGGGDHVVGGGVLGHEGRGAGLEGPEQLLVAGVHREHDDAQSALTVAQLAHQVEPGAVRQAYVGDHDVGLVAAGDSATPSATEPASATTVKSGVRSNARARPWRISSWSSTRSTDSTCGLVIGLASLGRVPARLARLADASPRL